MSEREDDNLKTGLALFRAEQYEEAIPYLQRAADAAASSEQRGPALNHLGMAQYVLGRYDDAVATFRMSILQTPGKPRLHYNLGNSLLAIGRLVDARRQYELALDIDPEYDEARKALVVVAAEAQAPPKRVVKSPPPSAPVSRPAPAASVSLAPAPSSPSPSPSTSSSSVSDMPAPSPGRVAELTAKIRETREEVETTRQLLGKLERRLDDLVESLLKVVHENESQREDAIQNAALRHAQSLLSEAVRGLGERLPGTERD